MDLVELDSKMPFGRWIEQVKKYYKGNTESHPELFSWWAAEIEAKDAALRLKGDGVEMNVVDLPTLAFDSTALVEVQRTRARRRLVGVKKRVRPLGLIGQVTELVQSAREGDKQAQSVINTIRELIR